MKVKITYYTALLFIISCTHSYADSWLDPSWRVMLDSSDVIALVEYISEGGDRARAKPIKIYQGELEDTCIWISGFANRYGPYDSMRVGDQYLVFINQYKPTESSLANWQKTVEEDPSLTAYFEGIKAGKVYHVWTPTSGDLHVKGKKLQYDLLSTTQSGEAKYFRLKEFESFLQSYFAVDKSSFHANTVKKLQKKAKSAKRVQLIMMLYFTGYDAYHDIYRDLADHHDPVTQFALARLLGQTGGTQARDLLIKLLDSENSIVQGEVVRQLSKEDPNIIGPILLSKLESGGLGGVYPTNIMDPVMNSLDGGKLEIIQTLGEMAYQPAGQYLLPLLEIPDDILMSVVVHALEKIGNTEYHTYLSRHLESRESSLIFDICRLIKDYAIEECKPALMEYISDHNRNEHPPRDYTISPWSGISSFDDEETRTFLLDDFNRHVNTDTIESRYWNSWTKTYLEAFIQLEEERAKSLVYDAIYHWTGIHQEFITHPELFEIKSELQDSITELCKLSLTKEEIVDVQSLVWIDNGHEYTKSFHSSYRTKILIDISPENLDLSKRDEIWHKMSRIRKHLSETINLASENIGIRSGAFVMGVDDRVDDQMSRFDMHNVYRYILKFP